MYKSYCSDVTDEEYLNWKSHNADYVAIKTIIQKTIWLALLFESFTLSWIKDGCQSGGLYG